METTMEHDMEAGVVQCRNTVQLTARASHTAKTSVNKTMVFILII